MFSPMPRTARTLRNTVKVRRFPKEGDELAIRVKVTKVGRNSFDTGDAVTFRISGFEYPVTVGAECGCRMRVTSSTMRGVQKRCKAPSYLSFKSLK